MVACSQTHTHTPPLTLWFKTFFQMCLNVGFSSLISPGAWFSTFDLVKHLYSFIYYLTWDLLYNGSDEYFSDTTEGHNGG